MRVSVLARVRAIGPVGLSVSAFFAVKMALGLLLLAAAARTLPVAGFTIFSQLLVLLAFLVTLATGGVQHGVIREVAAQQASPVALHLVIRAGLVIWAGVGALLVLGAALLAKYLSMLLVGSLAAAPVIPWLAAAAVGTGLGTLLCATLTGLGRPVASLGAQAVGLIAATALALVFLFRQEPVAAAAGFAAGPLLTTVAATPLVGRQALVSLRARGPLGPSVRHLLGFSAAFLVTAALMPLTLIGLRSVYLESFGLELLGYWLAANRISDVNTQLLGLYLTQDFLPKAAVHADDIARRALLKRTFLIGTGVMTAALVTFSLAPELWVTIFLSPKFLPAISFMLGYFVGDVLRVTAALVSYEALARKRLITYVLIEAAAAAGIAVIMLCLIIAGTASAPPIAYALTYALIAVGAAAFRRHARSLGHTTNAVADTGGITDAR